MNFDFDSMSIDQINELIGHLVNGTGGFERDFRDAAAAAEAGANRGDAKAQCLRGDFLAEGLGVAKDVEGALALWEKSAAQGYPPALHRLGMCAMGSVPGVEKDVSVAVDYFIIAAEKGFPESMMQLYALYRFGNGVAKDDEKAVKWLKAAVDADFAPAYVAMGSLLLQNADASPEQKQEGIGLIQKAAEDGDSMGQLLFGAMCENGVGVEKDLSEAAGWYRRAARAGNVQANEALKRLGFPGGL